MSENELELLYWDFLAVFYMTQKAAEVCFFFGYIYFLMYSEFIEFQLFNRILC